MIAFTVDAKHVMKKISTWLGLLSGSCGACLIAFGQLSDRAQEAFPHWLLATMTVIVVVGPLLVPLATSIQQSNIPKE